jgi:hypothetical protein
MSTSDGPDERRSTRWRRVVLTIGVLVGAGVVWGSLSPGRGGTDRCAEPVDDDRRARGRIRPGSNDRRRDARFRRRSPGRAQRAPPWCRLVASAALGSVRRSPGLSVLVVFGVALLRILGSAVAYLLLALFFSRSRWSPRSTTSMPHGTGAAASRRGCSSESCSSACS